jgi:hypothetical protein
MIDCRLVAWPLSITHEEYQLPIIFQNLAHLDIQQQRPPHGQKSDRMVRSTCLFNLVILLKAAGWNEWWSWRRGLS